MRAWALVIGQMMLVIGLFASPWVGGDQAPTWAIVIGYLIAIAALVPITLASRTLGAALTPMPIPTSSAQLQTSGMYALVRHPIYFGLIVAGAGLALRAFNLLGAVLAVALFVLLDAKSRFEEHLLRDRFPDYDDYARTVPRLLPSVRPASRTRG